MKTEFNFKFVVFSLNCIFVQLLGPIYTNSGATNFCHVQPILPGCLSDFARLSDRFWDRNFPISPSDFVQCDVRRSDAYKNRTDGLAKSVGQKKIRPILAFPCKPPFRLHLHCHNDFFFVFVFLDEQTSFRRIVRPNEKVPIYLSNEEVALHAGHKVLWKLMSVMHGLLMIHKGF